MATNDKVIVTKLKINNIVDAIHSKNGETTGYTLDQMPTKIQAISGGSGGGATITLTTEAEAFYGQEVTLTDGEDSMTTSFSNEGVAVFEGVEMEGELTVSVTVAGVTYTQTVVVQTHYNVTLNMFEYGLYGVSWNKGSNPSFSRTDDASMLVDPVPALNNGSGSSPFDSIYPWGAMERVTDPVVGELIKIPKFYFKFTTGSNLFKLQISSNPRTGFYTCPACMDRGDGAGERPYIYVSRYLCDSTYKSISGNETIFGLSLSTIRRQIHAVDSSIWNFDFATYITICMLYLVEFANWNSQEMIGYGKYITTGSLNGDTDNMEYHTGTVGATRNSVASIQYRGIENLWGGALCYCDGANMRNIDGTNYLVVQTNPAYFPNKETYVSTGMQTDFNTFGENKYFNVSESVGFEWVMFPYMVNTGYDNYDQYVCDYGRIRNTYGESCLAFGGGNDGGQYSKLIGLFLQEWDNSDERTTESINSYSCRFIKLP